MDEKRSNNKKPTSNENSNDENSEEQDASKEAAEVTPLWPRPLVWLRDIELAGAERQSFEKYFILPLIALTAKVNCVQLSRLIITPRT